MRLDPVISADFVRSVQDSLVVLGYYPAMTHLQTCLFKYTVTYHNIFGLQAFPNEWKIQTPFSSALIVPTVFLQAAFRKPESS